MKNEKCSFPLIVLLSVIVSLFSQNALACSEVYIGGDNCVSARNFDFMVGDGVALLTPRGQVHSSNYAMQGEKKLSWTSKYGSLSFWVKLPGCKENAPGGNVLAGVDGINEAGLKVGTYFLETSEFPQGNGGATLSITSVMQYLLDSFKTVSEAVNDLKKPAYRVIPAPTGLVSVKLHLYLHDCKGDSAIVEFIGGKTIVHRNPAITVLTNTGYDESLATLKEYAEFGGKKYIPGGNESLDRFVRGAFYKKHLPGPLPKDEAVNAGFAIVQILSVSPKFDHGCTQWTIVSDMGNKKVYFRTLGNPAVSSLDLDEIDFSKNQTPKTLDLTRQDLGGDIKKAFSAQ